MIRYSKTFESFEGEGPKIGLKTLFLTYNNNQGDEFDWNRFYRQKYRPDAVYINTEAFDEDLLAEIWRIQDRMSCFTYEIGLENLLHSNGHLQEDIFDLPGSFFLRIDGKDITKYDCNAIIRLANTNHVSFKIEAKNDAEFGQAIDIANFIADLTPRSSVYLMPLYKKDVGKYMQYALPLVNSKVRVMPPTQFLIDMK